MAQATLTIRMDADLKKQAEKLFAEMGMNMTTAYTIFTKAVVRQGKIPFEITADPRPNRETLSAIEEVRQMKADPSSGKGYTDVDLMMEELLR